MPNHLCDSREIVQRFFPLPFTVALLSPSQMRNKIYGADDMFIQFEQGARFSRWIERKKCIPGSYKINKNKIEAKITIFPFGLRSVKWKSISSGIWVKMKSKLKAWKTKPNQTIICVSLFSRTKCWMGGGEQTFHRRPARLFIGSIPRKIK